MPFQDLADRVREARQRVDEAVRRGGRGQSVVIVAVTKMHGPDAVQAAWDAGIRDVGENKVQEATRKMEQVSVPVRWHLIGHLQRNKVKSLGRFALMHSLDSARLADAVHEWAAGAPGAGRAGGREPGGPMDVLVQVNASGEETKGGYELAGLPAEAARLKGLDGLRVRGVMTMAPLDADERALRATFAGAREGRDILRDAGHPATELSMGMSNDYEIAVEEGATYVRLGTVLYGARPS
jgi:pyridoxal phosphate enzyme (YggS family)